MKSIMKLEVIFGLIRKDINNFIGSKGGPLFKNDSIRYALVGALLYYSENKFFSLLWRGCPGGKKTGFYYTKTGFSPPRIIQYTQVLVPPY